MREWWFERGTQKVTVHYAELDVCAFFDDALSTCPCIRTSVRS